MMPETSTRPISTTDVLPLAAGDLCCFSILTYPNFQAPPHILALIDRLEAVEAGHTKRLMVFLPPRHGKSVCASELFPCWFLGRHPDRNVIFVTYSADLSADYGRRTRNHVADPLQQAIFPNCILATDSQERFSLSAGGQYWALGRGSSVTGRGADLVIIDDPLSGAEEARSEAVRRSLKDWYRQTLYTRLSPGGAIVLIQTRWGQDDLAGWLLSEHSDEGWEVLSLPAIAEADDPLGRKEGEALWPSRYGLRALEATRKQLGSAAFSSLYQQHPVSEGAAIIKPHWWKFYMKPGDAVPEGCTVLPERFDQMAQSWDMTFKETRTSDKVCGGVWGRQGLETFSEKREL